MEKTQEAITVYAESTPNPSVMKFVANRMLLEGRSVEFKNNDEAQQSPLAAALFPFPFVKEVFISSNYVAITKQSEMEWELVAMEVRSFIRDLLVKGTAVISEADEQAPLLEEDLLMDELDRLGKLSEEEQQIHRILEEYVRPAVEQDGGNIQLKSFKDGIVTVILQGACSGCPSSTITLKQGIETILKKMMPDQIEEVVAENQ